MKTRQYILEATERVIQSKGLARVTTKEIAKEAGCTEGTLYKHFVDKEDLFLAVIQENLPHVVATVHEERAGKGTVSDNLEDMAHAIMQAYSLVIIKESKTDRNSSSALPMSCSYLFCSLL